MLEAWCQPHQYHLAELLNPTGSRRGAATVHPPEGLARQLVQGRHQARGKMGT